jgi:hypothetical protein
LSIRVLLLGSFVKPFHRLCIIRRHAKLAPVKCHTQIELRLGVAFFRLVTENGELCGIIVVRLGMGELWKQTDDEEQCYRAGRLPGPECFIVGFHLHIFSGSL